MAPIKELNFKKRLSKIRLGWKCQAVKSSLAYSSLAYSSLAYSSLAYSSLAYSSLAYTNAPLITTIERFIVQAAGVNVIKL